ncbi:hypothetical protein GXM_02408 [Nostoc sphaeroides CCNUC1]|uniref:Uncharacterized protein n=1 Tax=Nostoc sphaeroides CCNUC1 TaxID=2653204 RepID=A0A5P8VWY1_9NOSO|nr:hypothetical protein GXM_02408 [Nostoc sphaeroides CCNUC1]
MSFFIPNSSLLTPNSSLLTPHSSLFTLYFYGCNSFSSDDSSEFD